MSGKEPPIKSRVMDLDALEAFGHEIERSKAAPVSKKGAPPTLADVGEPEFAPERIETVVETIVAPAPPSQTEVPPQPAKRPGRKVVAPEEERAQLNMYLRVSQLDKLDALRMEGVKRARNARPWAEVIDRLLACYEAEHGKIEI